MPATPRVLPLCLALVTLAPLPPVVSAAFVETADVRRPAGPAVAAQVVRPVADAPARDLSGPITKVDLDARTLTFTDAVAGPVTVLVDENSVIDLDGDDQAALDDLFAGDEVVRAAVKKLASGRLLLDRAVVTSKPGPPASDEEAGDGEGGGDGDGRGDGRGEDGAEGAAGPGGGGRSPGR